jgi:4'-phosphopantetheinyl transferase
MREGELHVWSRRLDVEMGIESRLVELLSADEVARARRFAFPRDRRRFVVARGTLRSLLADFLGVQADEIAFGYTRLGKPFLVRPEHARDLHFSVSHAHELAVYVVAKAVVGIDIEWLRPLPRLQELASTVLSAAERARLFELESANQVLGFFNAWTRKEAYLKARGIGLMAPPECFDVSLAPHAPAELLANRYDADDVRRWHLRAFTPAAGYVGALATDETNPTIVFRESTSL